METFKVLVRGQTPSLAWAVRPPIRGEAYRLTVR